MSEHKYKQKKGRDDWSTCDDDDNRKYRGKAEYGENGELVRYDNYSQFSDDGGHRHEWINRLQDGSYEYGTHSRRDDD